MLYSQCVNFYEKLTSLDRCQLKSQVALASLILVIWMYYHEKLALSTQVVESTALGMLVTDEHGKINTLNPSFTYLTGYSQEEMKGQNPNVLSAGKHSTEFYQNICGIK